VNNAKEQSRGEVLEEQTLPTIFEERRERMFESISAFNTSHSNQDMVSRENFIRDYVDLVEYIVTRIKPKFSGNDLTTLDEIQEFTRKFITKYDKNPTIGIPYLNTNHERLARLLTDYGFDTILRHRAWVG